MNPINHWAVRLNALDNVATIFDDVQTHDIVEIKDLDGVRILSVEALQPIPQGHKIALKNISCAQPIIKYGEIIGCAAREIHQGEWTHIHNLESLRGRGDRDD